MKLLFVYQMPPEHEIYWRDGLWAATKVLEQDWEITRLNVWDNPDWEEEFYRSDADFFLGWGSVVSPHFMAFVVKGDEAGWCIGGGNPYSKDYEKFKVVFVENKSYLVQPNFRLAFGTNTELFRPLPQPKILDALYPAAFAAWKHQEIFAQICKDEGLKGLAVGYIQLNNLDESLFLLEACTTRGVGVMDWVPNNSIVYLYNMSKEVIITADTSGGCERAILEAKACNVPVRLVSDSEKLHEWNKLTHEEVVKDWNHVEYARMLREGINEVTSNRK